MSLLPACMAVATLLALATAASAQLRDSFETPQPTWRLASADCGVRELLHERTYREARTGQAEHFRLQVGTGTYAYLVQPIGKAPLIPEFRPTLFVKASRPSVQLQARVVFPRNIDPGTGRPIASFLRGDLYTDVGHWQQLAVRDAGRLLDQEVRLLRTQFGPDVDGREAYVDLIVLNAYSAPGMIDLWLDDLEIEGYVNLEETQGPQIARRSGLDLGLADLPPSAATVQGSLLLVRSRPLMVRAIQHRGEPLEWLKSLGFNTIKLSASPSPADLKEARRLGLWLIAPPPYPGQTPPPDAFEPIIAWSVGSRLTSRDLAATHELVREVRTADPLGQRPLMAGAEAGFAEYSRLANLLLLDRPTLGTSQELAELRGWLLGRQRLARPGTPALAAVETQRNSNLGEQLLLFGRGAAWEEDIDPEQIRLAAYHAIAAGARGLIFQSDQALAVDTGPAALRTDALRLVNMELRLLEPWIAAGQVIEELASGDSSVQASVLATDRSKLLIATQHSGAQQYVLGPPPRRTLWLVVPGVGISHKAYHVSLAAIKPLQLSHTGGGARIVLDEAPHAAAIVITQDPLAMHHLYKTLDEVRAHAARLKYDVTLRRLARVIEIDQALSGLGHPLSPAAAWLQEAQAALAQARRLLDANDFENAHAATAKAEQLQARVRRGHWEQTASGFPSPAASPCISQFTTLPLHWAVAARMRQARFGPNVQPAGDMESLDQMLAAGWQQQRAAPDGVNADVALSLADPHSGRSALRVQAWPADPQRAPQVIERPVVWITSAPVPVRQGQIAKIHGWASVPRPIVGATDGLLIFDSIGGSDLGERVRLTQGWRAFTLYRAVPHNGDLTITLALTGLGEASIDDLSVSLLDPDPIRPQ